MELDEKISELSDCLELLTGVLDKLESIREAKTVYDRLERDYSKIEDIIDELQSLNEDQDFEY